MKSNHHPNNPEDRLSFSQLITYGSGGLIPIALFNVTGQLIGLMGNISLGLSAFWLAVVLIIPRLGDAVSGPVVGHISDNMQSRWGRRRPFILIGGLAVAFSFVLMWWIPDGEWIHNLIPSESGFKWFQLSYILVLLLIFFTAVSVFEIPHGALGIEMATDYHERTRLFSAKSFIGSFFGFGTPWLFALANMEVFKGEGNEADGMRYVSVIIAVLVIPLTVWWFFSLREPGIARIEKRKKSSFKDDFMQTISNKVFIRLTVTFFILAMGFNFVTLLSSSYIPIFYIYGGDKAAAAGLMGLNGTVWAVTALLAVFPLNWLDVKIGKQKTLFVAILLMVLGQLSKIFCYNPAHPYLAIIPLFPLSLGMTFFFTLGSSMVADICDEDDLRTGTRSEGSYFSIFWWFIKMGTSIATLVSGILIVFTQFDEAQGLKVDDLQVNLRGIRKKALYWQQQSADTTLVALKDILRSNNEEALKESSEFLVYLERESGRMEQYTNKNTTPEKYRRENLLLRSLSVTKNTVFNLKKLLSDLDSTGTGSGKEYLEELLKDVIPLTLETRLQKARMNAMDLLLYLEVKAQESRNSSAHYKKLMGILPPIQNRLDNISSLQVLDKLYTEAGIIEEDIRLLTSQPPYTLLMMRVVEVGFPVLLSLLAILFILKYPLTEKRCYEIQEALKCRNREREV